MKNVRAAVLHVNGARYASTSPTMRIARFAAEEMGIPLIHDSASATKYAKRRFDVLFVKYGLLKFSDHREEALRLHQCADMVINLENDYTFKPEKRMALKGEYRRWTTVQWGKMFPQDCYVNWNVLTWQHPDAWGNTLLLPKPDKKGLLYYGAHRAGRVAYFKKYFDAAPYFVTISTFKGRRAFQETCRDVEVIGAFRDPALPARWPLTVYIEDERSHSLYCSPANRFYECVQMGLAQAIDVCAAGTLIQAGLTHVDDFVVNSKRELAKLFGRWSKVQRAQREYWYKDYTAELRSQLRAACRRSFGASCGM